MFKSLAETCAHTILPQLIDYVFLSGMFKYVNEASSNSIIMHIFPEHKWIKPGSKCIIILADILKLTLF